MSELTYTFVFFALMVGAGAFLIYFFARRVRQGLWLTHAMGLMTWLYFFSTFIGALGLSFLPQPIAMPFDNFLAKIVGGIMILSGLMVLLWAFRAYEFSYRRLSAIRVDKLITSGPYKYVRNPQYVASCLSFYGLGLLLNSFPFLVYCLLITVGYHFMVLIEERGLEQKFGEKYLEYKRAVPRFIPRLRHRLEG